LLRKTTAIVTAIVIGAALFAAQVTFAHSRPIRLDPPPGAVLQTAPSQVTGWFTSDIRRDPNWSFLSVADAQGNSVTAGEVQLSTDRRQMSVPLRAGLSGGRYTVTYRTFDDGDGAIFGDCYTFYVGQAAADAGFTDKTRLDGGGATCQRIDVSAKDGTPVPGQTPQASAGTSAGDDDEGSTASSSSGKSGSDVPAWGLIVGIIGGVAVGGIGGRFIGTRS
jgi:methionine-rich copper-binding protein CopC